MITAAWRNKGSHNRTGAGYGIRIAKTNRNKCFKREWKYVILELEGEPNSYKVNTAKASFWEDCVELINKDNGKWLIENNRAPWKKDNPPKIRLQKIKDNMFKSSFL